MTEENLSPWEKYKKNLGDTRPWHILDKENYTTQEEADRRLSICQKCPEFFHPIKQCKKCGCLMKMKTKLKEATCPINKW